MMYSHIMTKAGDKDPRLPILKSLEKDAVCCEIGTWRGEFSEHILRIARPRMLHLIDPWKFFEGYPERAYGGSVATSQEDMDRIYEDVKRKFGDRADVVIHRGMSEETLQDFSDGYFDWVYIDGDHSYDVVSVDLRICLSKVRAGGMIVGDDYGWGRKDGFPVRRAVDDFVKASNIADRLSVRSSQYLIQL